MPLVSTEAGGYSQRLRDVHRDWDASTSARVSPFTECPPRVKSEMSKARGGKFSLRFNHDVNPNGVAN